MKDIKFRGIIKEHGFNKSKMLLIKMSSTKELKQEEVEVNKVPDNSTSGLFHRFNPLFCASHAREYYAKAIFLEEARLLFHKQKLVIGDGLAFWVSRLISLGHHDAVRKFQCRDDPICFD